VKDLLLEAGEGERMNGLGVGVNLKTNLKKKHPNPFGQNAS
jgi:hypothetical protein